LEKAIGQISPNQSRTIHAYLYIGPHPTSTANHRYAMIGEGLDKTKDFGFLSFLSNTMISSLQEIKGLVGNWGWAIVLLTMFIKIVVLPLDFWGNKESKKVAALAKKIDILKEECGHDSEKLLVEMRKLYRDAKANPFMPIVPVILQLPVILALYWSLTGAIELRHAPWALWIHDLSQPDPLHVLPLVSFLLSLFIGTRLKASGGRTGVSDYISPAIVGIFMMFMPSGLVLYWLTSNLFNAMNKTLVRIL
jgi:YidC/Oxa1 family membrane protein insertase